MITTEALLYVNFVNGMGLPVPTFYDFDMTMAATLLAIQSDLDAEIGDAAGD